MSADKPRRIAIPRSYREFAAVLQGAGFACYFVGGAVRDSLMGRAVSDWDAATDASPSDVMKLYRHVIPTGVKHGTVTVRWKGASIETTTFRIDGAYADGRRPDDVKFTSNLEDDLSRRDFTINGMAADPFSGAVIDVVGGLSDLDERLVRAIGDPDVRFGEDGLRPLRAVRFAARLGFAIEEGTLAAMPRALGRTRLVSSERIRDEFTKIIMADDPSRGLSLLDGTGLLELILPELSACRGEPQGGPHRYDVLGHLLASCAAAPPDPALRLAALLHDVGKPAKRVLAPDGSSSFHGHDKESARIAEAALRRLKYPNDLISTVAALVANHMFDYSDAWTDAAVRRFVARVGAERVKPLALLRLADSSGMGRGPADPRTVLPLVERVEAMLSRSEAIGVRDLAIGGDDLAALGWPRGPKMGLALAELLEAVLDDPALNDAERLRDIASRLKPKYGL